MRRFVAVCALAFSLAVAGCHPRMLGNLIMAAAIVGTVAVLAAHDAHFHDHYCGHHRRWHDGRWIYGYHGHWEYYDPSTGTWYYYEE